MSPCSCRTGSAAIGPPSPLTLMGSARDQPVLGHDRRIFAARRRLEAVSEALAHGAGRGLVQIDIDAPATVDEQRAQVVDAVGVVGVLVRVEHRVDPIDVGVEQLLAQIRRGVDQHPGDAGAVAALDQQRGAAAAVLGILRVAVAPAEPGARNAAGRAAAEDLEVQRHAAVKSARAAGRGTLSNSLKKLALVWRAISSGETARVSAKTLAVSTT